MRVEVEGIGIDVQSIGRGPTAILFVHGLGASSACWQCAPEFFDPDRTRLILPDLPGFGRSERPEDFDYSMGSLAALLRGLLRCLEQREIHVVAHSMGCAVALLLLDAGDLRARSFVAAEGNLVTEDAFMSARVARMSEPAFVRGFTKWILLVERSLEPRQVHMHEVFLDSLREAAPLAVHRASVSCARLSASGELSRRFDELECPRAYVVGGLSQRGLPSVVRKPGIELMTVAGQGHFMMDDADGFYSRVRDWIDRRR